MTDIEKNFIKTYESYIQTVTLLKLIGVPFLARPQQSLLTYSIKYLNENFTKYFELTI